MIITATKGLIGSPPKEETIYVKLQEQLFVRDLVRHLKRLMGFMVQTQKKHMKCINRMKSLKHL